MVLLVFAAGKSPVFRVDRAGAAVIGTAAVVGLGVVSFDDAAHTVAPRTFSVSVPEARFDADADADSDTDPDN